MVSEHTANRFVLHAGQVLTINLYNRQQVNDPRYNPLTMPPAHRARLTIAGIGVFTDEVVQDDVDRIDRLLATPAFTRQQLACCGDYTWVGLKLDHGAQDVPAVQREYARLIPHGPPLDFRVTTWVKGQRERSIRPASVAAAVFGLIARSRRSCWPGRPCAGY
jgi:hypothetical protein